MGVPALFRWLSRKYPKIISPVVEDVNPEDPLLGPRYDLPNPNGELDNLYLDMNGIVHPCSHPEHKPPPATEDEMFLDVFKYTDRVLMMARPRKVLVIAVDGVAPRAKMNQQRSRRFRLSQDAKIADAEKQRQIAERESRGELIDEAIKGKKSWDTNAITPGTPFMDRLAEALRYWVAYKLLTDPGWKDLQVIISDALVPGEGEHKLMSFIRSQRSDPLYSPNTKHAIYGLDADLIFLGLATHEPHFRVLREDVFASNSRTLRTSDLLSMTDDQRQAIEAQDAKKPFLWLHVNVLREYLAVELQAKQSFPFDLERAVDDWIFMCFFVGNDFLPHLPSLDVRDNGIDVLIGCWKRVLPRLRTYITCDGKLDLTGVELLLGALAQKENDIFRRKYDGERRREEADQRRKAAQEEEKRLKKQFRGQISGGQDRGQLYANTDMPLLTTQGEAVDGFLNMSNLDIVSNRGLINNAGMNNMDAAQKLRELIQNKASSNASTTKENELKNDEKNEDENDDDDYDPETDLQIENEEDSQPVVINGEESAASVMRKRKYEEESEESEVPTGVGNTPTSTEVIELPTSGTIDTNELVRMWEPGYHDRYYTAKFQITEAEVDGKRRELVKSYIEGISWVLLYYYQGCPSWNWFYPFHYAPFAADFADLHSIIGDEGVKFEKGEPFRPFEQLMSVFPASSGHHLPEVFRDLMLNPDSEIIDFYPEEFVIDMNGKKMSWQGISLLPFIEETRLLNAVRSKYDQLTDYEKNRNTNKQEVLYISRNNKNYEKFTSELYDNKKVEVKFSCYKTQLGGTLSKDNCFNPDGISKFPLNEGDMPNLHNVEFFTGFYRMPFTYPGKLMLLNGYIPHTLVLTQEDKDAMYQRGNYQGNRFRTPQDNEGYVNNGPQGEEVFKMYSARAGGYRSLVTGASLSTPQGNHQRGYNNYGGQRQQSYGSRSYHTQGGFKQGGYNQGGYNQGGYNQGGYNQGGYNQGGYNQGGYNQGGYNQGGYNQGGYNQGGYNQGGYNQGGYNQGGYNQGGYNQGGHNQGGYNGGRHQGGHNGGHYQSGFNQGGHNQRNQGGYNQGGYNQGGYNKNGYRR